MLCMRGIAGLIHLDCTPLAPERIGRLLQAMALGRLDRQDHATVGGAGFARLQRDVVVEDRHDAQPLRSRDGNLLLVTDALLENRAELTSALGWSTAEASAQADSALVLAAYEKWGETCPTRLEGKWAFAVWHARERRLFAAVDHFSFRPIYYFRRGPLLAFATTLRALLSLPEVSREIVDEMLGDFLVYARSRPEQTLYRDIKSIPAAHALRVDAAGETLQRYWRADPHHELRLGRDADYLDAFRGELDHAVAAALRVQGQVGVMLSGGLDSAAVTAVAGRMLTQRGQRLQAIHQLPPAGDPRRAWLREHDESPHVRKMQAHMPHIDFHFVPPALAGQQRVSFDRMARLFSENAVPLHGLPLERLPDAPAPHPLQLDLGLTLFGLGGNYTVSLEEYPSTYFAQLAVQLRWLRLARELSGHARFYGATVRHLVKYRVLHPLLGHGSSQPDGRAALLESLNPDFVRRAGLREKLKQPRWRRRDISVRHTMAWILDELMPQNRGLSPALIGSEFTGMGASPLMSYRINQFCLALPIEQQLRDGQDRLMLRHAMLGLLPEEVIWRKTRGLPTPNSWAVARAVIAALPATLPELEKSSLVGRYVDLREFRRRFAGGDESELRRIGAPRLVDLFNVACFLRWLERESSSTSPADRPD